MTIDDIGAIRDVPSIQGKVSPAEWRARTELAACYRLAHRDGWNNGIYNHCTVRAPDDPDRFLIKAHKLMWDEITASNLISVNMHDELDEGSKVNRPGFVLHSAIMRARPDVQAIVHIHPESCIAVSASKDGLLPTCQQALRFYGRMAYHDYEGITENADERDRIVANLGDKPAMLMRNHGATTLGPSIADAYVMMGNLISACEIQLQLQAAGVEMSLPSPELCEATVAQIKAHEAGRGQDDWPGRMRELDRMNAGYRD